MLLYLATADVGDGTRLIFILIVSSKSEGIVGVTRATIHRAVDTTTHDIDSLEAACSAIILDLHSREMLQYCGHLLRSRRLQGQVNLLCGGYDRPHLDAEH